MTDKSLRDKGFTLYKKGMTYREISERLGVTLSCVKSWASRYWKVAQEKPKRKKGGQPNNKNSVGHKSSTPKGNQNALKHGGYSKLLFKTFTDEQLQQLQNEPQTEEEMLQQEIDLLTLRESYLLERIEIAKQTPLHLKSVKNVVTKGADDVEHKVTNTETEANTIVIERLERLLSSAQFQKTKAISQLLEAKIKSEAISKISTPKENNLLEAILSTTKEDMDTDDIQELQ